MKKVLSDLLYYSYYRYYSYYSYYSLYGFELIAFRTKPVRLLFILTVHVVQRKPTLWTKLNHRLLSVVLIEDVLTCGRMYARLLLADPEMLLRLRRILAHKRFTVADRTFPWGNFLTIT